MRRDGVRSRSQSYLHGTLRHYAVALLNTRQYLYTLAVALAQRHLLLAVALRVYLHVDEVDALLLGEGGEGQRDDVVAVLGYEVYLGVRACTTSPVLLNSKMTGRYELFTSAERPYDFMRPPISVMS